MKHFFFLSLKMFSPVLRQAIFSKGVAARTTANSGKATQKSSVKQILTTEVLSALSFCKSGESSWLAESSLKALRGETFV